MHVLVVRTGENTPAVQWQTFVRDWTDVPPRRQIVIKWTWCTTELFRMPIKFSFEIFVSYEKTVLIRRNTKMPFALYDSGTLAIDNPVALQMIVYLEVSLHFCRIVAGEGMASVSYGKTCSRWKQMWMRRNMWHWYIMSWKKSSCIEKNDIDEEPRMHSQAGHLCPVSSFKLYISKLHIECAAFFQRANTNYKSSGQWYYVHDEEYVQSCRP